MGSNTGPEDERPQHRVEVAEFFIDRTKVTNLQFALFLNAIGPSGPQNENISIPMTMTRGCIGAMVSGWQTVGLNLIRWSKRRGMVPLRIADGRGSVCRRKRSGKRLRAAPTHENIPGAMSLLIVRGRTSVLAGTSLSQW